MRVPSSIKIGGLTYKVIKNFKFSKKDGSNYKIFIGDANHKNLEIRLSTNGISREKVEETFLHEVLHCVDDIYNNNSLSERSINSLSCGLYQVLKDNNLLK